MHQRSIVIRHSILVKKPREIVWDYTQDYARRPEWDPAVLSSKVLETSPHRIVEVMLRDKSVLTFRYKQDERPYKTSLATQEVRSSLIASGGGSWVYETEGGHTRWTQTNSLVLKNRWWLVLLLPLLRHLLTRQTRRAMEQAKRQIEAN